MTRTTPECCRPITEYGCALCQTYHRKGLDAEYEDHIMLQSKDGLQERAATPNEVLERLGKEE